MIGLHNSMFVTEVTNATELLGTELLATEVIAERG